MDSRRNSRNTSLCLHNTIMLTKHFIMLTNTLLCMGESGGQERESRGIWAVGEGVEAEREKLEIDTVERERENLVGRR